MSEWITYRLPLKGDADANGNVLQWIKEYDGCRWVIRHWQHVGPGSPWMPMPKPYQQPEPDTSLSASIEQIETAYPIWKTLPHLKDHIERILEAARKWDEFEKECVPLTKDEIEKMVRTAVQAPDDYTPPKPQKAAAIACIELKEWDRLKEVEDQYVELIKRCSDCQGCDGRAVHAGKPSSVSMIGCWLLLDTGDVLLFNDPLGKMPDGVVAWIERRNGEYRSPQQLMEWFDKHIKRDHVVCARGTDGCCVDHAVDGGACSDSAGHDARNQNEYQRWVDEMIRLCEDIRCDRYDTTARNRLLDEIDSHLAKRGEK